MSGRATVQRMLGVQAPVIPIISDWIAETPGTISLGQGVVSWGPPPQALDALRRFPEGDAGHSYGPVEGLPALIDRLARKLEAENGIAPRGNRIMVTAGGNQAFMNAILAITNPGDEVILQVPYYFNHDMAIAMAGCTTVPVPADDGYRLRLDAIASAITPRTRAIVTVSPNNPTGVIYSQDDLRGVNALCRDRGLYHISDEVYEYFVYDDARQFSPASIPGAEEWTISLYSLSKAYGMASWRIGYMAAPEALWPSIVKIQDTIVILPAHPSQLGAVAALDVGRAWTEKHLAPLARMRAHARQMLGGVADVPRADGAFYYLLKADTPLDSMTACERLIREHKVAVTPGSAFGLTSGCYLRVSFGALEEATADAGLRRLADGLRALR